MTRYLFLLICLTFLYFPTTAQMEVIYDSTGDTPQLKLTETDANGFGRIKFNNGGNDHWDIAGGTGTLDLLNFFFWDGSSGENIISIDGAERGVQIGEFPQTISPNSSKLSVYNDGSNANNNRNNGIFVYMDQAASQIRRGISCQVRGEGEGEGEGQKYGVQALAASSGNTKVGVEGFAGGGKGANYGVYGIVNNSGTNNYGVYGYSTTNDANTWAGYFDGDLNYTGTLTNISDGRMKKSIKKMNRTLEKVMQLQPKNYEFDHKKFHFANLPEGNQYGFISQEVEELFPELVHTAIHSFNDLSDPDQPKSNPTEIKTLNYIGFIPILTRAIQEQQSELEDVVQLAEQLETENAQLRTQNNDLAERLNRIEQKLAGMSLPNSTTNVISATVSNAMLAQNAPNPFSENTSIHFHIPEQIQQASLQIVDMNGNVLKNIVIAARGAGQLDLQARTLSAGSYSYQLVLDGQITETRKMILTK